NRLGADAFARQADLVDAVEGRLDAHRLHERQSVHGDHAVAAAVGMAADAAELVHRGEGADARVVVHLDVTGQGGVVGEDRAAPHLAVVRDVGVDHEEVVAADAGDAAPLRSTAVHGTSFTELVAIADLDGDPLAAELQVLRLEADAGVGEDAVLAADSGRPFDLGSRGDLGAFADLDLGTDDGERTDADAVGEHGARVHDGERMDLRAHRAARSARSRSTMAVDRIASAASSPSTRTLPATLPKVERSRNTSTS